MGDRGEQARGQKVEAAERPVSKATPILPERVVWKFTVPVPTSTGRAWIDAPASAELLSAGIQGDELVVWALIDPHYEPDEHEQAEGMFRLIVANTGTVVPGFPEGAYFLGMVTHLETGTVWHVWDGDAGTTA